MMPFSKWLEIAHKMDLEKPMNNITEHFYFQTGCGQGYRNEFMKKDLPLFSTKKENFFITNVAANRGIQCRFGMRGIIAESHFDMGKNFVAQLKGMKRYILNPPEACSKLGIITEKKHPSYRHSIYDWSDAEQAKSHGFKNVMGIDTIMLPGQVLYIPSFWYHYIISLTYSIQCNSRSGTPDGNQGVQATEECMHEKFANLDA